MNFKKFIQLKKKIIKNIIKFNFYYPNYILIIKQGNHNYDQIDRYNGRSRNNGGNSYNSRDNEGSSYSSRNNGGQRYDGYSPINRHGSPPDSPPGYSRNQGNDVASRFSGRVIIIIFNIYIFFFHL